MSSKNLNTSISIPVWQIIATASLLYLMPPPESVETTLLSVLEYKQSVWAVKALLLVIVVLIPFYLHQKETKTLSKKELKELLLAIQKTVENNYTIHQREYLYPNISKAMDEEGVSGFDIPQGSFTGRLFDISLDEISAFSSIIHDASLSFINHENISFSSPVFIGLFNDLLIAHNTKIKKYHYSEIADLFDYGNSTIAKNIVDDFNKQAEIETKLRFKKLLSTLKIKNLSACNAMVFPVWTPVEKKKPIKHIYTPKKTS